MVMADDPIVEQLQTDPESDRLPEYRRVGQPSADGAQVEIITVKQKLIGSEPFVPLLSKADSDARLHGGRQSIWYSIGMMFVGLALIYLIHYLEQRKLKQRFSHETTS